MKLVHPDEPSATGRGEWGRGGANGGTSAFQSEGEPGTFYTLEWREYRKSVTKLNVNANSGQHVHWDVDRITNVAAQTCPRLTRLPHKDHSKRTDT